MTKQTNQEIVKALHAHNIKQIAEAKVTKEQADKKIEGVITNDKLLAKELGPKVVTPEDIHTLPATALAIAALGGKQ